MRIFQAFAVFFKVLFQREFAEQLRDLERQPALSAPAKTTSTQPPPSVPAPAKPKPPSRNDAITLLATLQREARFVDIVMEPLGDYTDAQVGAATRDVLRDCGQTLERLFAIQPVIDAEDGAPHETPAKMDTARYRVTGNVVGEPPYRGQLVHHGWQATRCELPKWTGSDDAALIVAPVELNVT